jgi:hypothetical protein
VRVCMFYVYTRENMDIGAHTRKQIHIHVHTQRHM